MKIVINTQNAVISIDDSNNDININVVPVSINTQATDNKPKIETITKELETVDTKEPISKNRQSISHKAIIEPENSALYDELSSLRRQISSDEGIPPYMVMHDKTLIEMCKTLPLDFDSLLAISGIGSRKIDKYGNKFIEIIKSHIDQTED
jgi:ATP-dependent DNA helicase RecQ